MGDLNPRFLKGSSAPGPYSNPVPYKMAVELPELVANTSAWVVPSGPLVIPRKTSFTSILPPLHPKHHHIAAASTSSVAAMIHFLRRVVIPHVGAAQTAVNLLRRANRTAASVA